MSLRCDVSVPRHPRRSQSLTALAERESLAYFPRNLESREWPKRAARLVARPGIHGDPISNPDGHRDLMCSCAMSRYEP